MAFVYFVERLRKKVGVGGRGGMEREDNDGGEKGLGGWVGVHARSSV